MLLLAVHHGLIRVCLSQEIVAEYRPVLARPKFAFPPDEIEALLVMLRDKGELFPPAAETPAVSPDPTDTKFLQCALAARAEFIVTGNKRHFPDAFYGATRVVNARELLDRITLDI